MSAVAPWWAADSLRPGGEVSPVGGPDRPDDEQLEATMAALRPLVEQALSEQERQLGVSPEAVEHGRLTGEILRELLAPRSEEEGG